MSIIIIIISIIKKNATVYKIIKCYKKCKVTVNKLPLYSQVESTA